MKTNLQEVVRLCVANHTPEELALGYLRYEAVRLLSPTMFSSLHIRNLNGEWFDDVITEALINRKSDK